MRHVLHAAVLAVGLAVLSACATSSGVSRDCTFAHVERFSADALAHMSQAEKRALLARNLTVESVCGP